jgi:hypothetical protein
MEDSFLRDQPLLPPKSPGSVPAMAQQRIGPRKLSSPLDVRLAHEWRPIGKREFEFDGLNVERTTASDESRPPAELPVVHLDIVVGVHRQDGARRVGIRRPDQYCGTNPSSSVVG